MNAVYVIDFGGKVKIGYTTNPQKRIRSIETQSGANAINSFFMEAERVVEKEAHYRLSDSHLMGEYFSVGFERAVDMVKQIAANPPDLSSTTKTSASQKRA